jgi:hypothetical protein
MLKRIPHRNYHERENIMLKKLSFKAEPVMILAAIEAVIALIIAYGVNVTQDQSIAILGVVSALFAVFGRSRVTPVAMIPLPPPPAPPAPPALVKKPKK